MAFDVQEMFNSRKANLAFNEQSATLLFVGYGTDDDAEARQGFIDATPLIWQGLMFQNLDVERVGGLLWKAEASYSSAVTPAVGGQTGDPGIPPDPPPPPTPSPMQPLDPGFSFDISGVTEKITQSRSTRSRNVMLGRPIADAPDNQGTIGITADGSIEGCERISPRFEWSLTRIAGWITLGYLYQLYKLVGKTNIAPFYGFPVDTTLFVGCSGKSKDIEKTEITFKFWTSPNENNIIIHPSLSVPEKHGHDYIWFAYEPVVKSGVPFMQAYAAYVEVIYEQGDFSLLGMGGS